MYIPKLEFINCSDSINGIPYDSMSNATLTNSLEKDSFSPDYGHCSQSFVTLVFPQLHMRPEFKLFQVPTVIYKSVISIWHWLRPYTIPAFKYNCGLSWQATFSGLCQKRDITKAAVMGWLTTITDSYCHTNTNLYTNMGILQSLHNQSSSLKSVEDSKDTKNSCWVVLWIVNLL